jgi:hypothetical protein
VASCTGIEHEHSSARSNHPRHLGDRRRRVAHVLHHSFGAHRIEARVIELKRYSVAHLELDQRLTASVSCVSDHRFGCVDPDHTSARADQLDQVGAHLAEAAPDVEDRPSFVDAQQPVPLASHFGGAIRHCAQIALRRIRLP